eukprot:403333720
MDKASVMSTQKDQLSAYPRDFLLGALKIVNNHQKVSERKLLQNLDASLNLADEACCSVKNSTMSQESSSITETVQISEANPTQPKNYHRRIQSQILTCKRLQSHYHEQSREISRLIQKIQKIKAESVFSSPLPQKISEQVIESQKTKNVPKMQGNMPQKKRDLKQREKAVSLQTTPFDAPLLQKQSKQKPQKLVEIIDSFDIPQDGPQKYSDEIVSVGLAKSQIHQAQSNSKNKKTSKVITENLIIQSDLSSCSTGTSKNATTSYLSKTNIQTNSILGGCITYQDDNTNQSIGQIECDTKLDEILLMEDNTYQDIFSNNNQNNNSSNFIGNMLYKNTNNLPSCDDVSSHLMDDLDQKMEFGGQQDSHLTPLKQMNQQDLMNEYLVNSQLRTSQTTGYQSSCHLFGSNEKSYESSNNLRVQQMPQKTLKQQQLWQYYQLQSHQIINSNLSSVQSSQAKYQQFQNNSESLF